MEVARPRLKVRGTYRAMVGGIGRELQWLVKGLDPKTARAQGEREKGLHEALPLQLQHVRLSEADEADQLELAELSGEEETDDQWPSERVFVIRKKGSLESGVNSMRRNETFHICNRETVGGSPIFEGAKAPFEIRDLERTSVSSGNLSVLL